MKIKQPEPFTFEAGPRAVLLLHGFTGHSADVRMLGRYLEKKGYTSHAPIYRGHGKSPEELTQTNSTQWWEDVVQAYEHLQALGYKEIAVAGLSLGGALGLKLANRQKVQGIITMCSPVYFENIEQLTSGFRFFAKQYKQFEKKNEATIEAELKTLMDRSTPMFADIEAFFKEVTEVIDSVYAPALVVQGEKDQMVNPQSAQYIYDHLASNDKTIKWYKESGHVITMDKEKDLLHEDVYMFLESLNWEQ